MTRPTAAAICTGGILLIWPAILNGYPILFSDTGGLLEMGFGPSMGWDKPWVYGPLVAVATLRWTLWLPCLAQGVLLSYMLWLVGGSGSPPTRHALLCLVLALGTAAPWVTATMIPDALTPVVVLGIAALTSGRLERPHRLAAVLITTVATAAHLSHLILAAACIAASALLRRAIPWQAAATLAAALLFLLASNIVGHGRFGISPYGSVFALARLVADGPARDYLAQACPEAGYRLCAWRDQLTDDSDQFLWDPQSPFWADPTPLPQFAAEARQIVAGTIAAFPLRVAADAWRNTVAGLGRVKLGDTLTANSLTEAVRSRLVRYLQADVPRYDRSLQAQARLQTAAGPFIPVQLAMLGLGALGCAALLARNLRQPTPLADLAALILIALAANAFATGALSTPHDRYQLRLAWLLLIPPLLGLPRSKLPLPPGEGRGEGQAKPPRPSSQAARLATSSGDIRTSAS